MFRPLALYIGLRYTRAKRRNHFISFISLISMLGIALGVTTLVTVLSVMNGFDGVIKHRVFSMAPQMRISTFDGTLDHWQPLAKKVKAFPGIEAASPYVLGQGLLSNMGTVTPGMITGIDPKTEEQVSKVASKITQGSLNSLQPGKFGIVIGEQLAENLSLQMGDKVTVVTPKATLTPVGVIPRFKRFTVVGIFKAGGGFGFDTHFAYINLKDAQTLFSYAKGTISGLQLKIDNLNNAPRYTQELAAKLTGTYLITNWTEEYGPFFKAIQLEKTMMFIILLLIVAVAAFNLVSSLVMVVTDKQADIAILRTFGATPRTIMGIFIVVGCVVGIVGTLLGLLGGILLATHVTELVNGIQNLTGFQFLSSNVYYVNYLPSKLQWSDVWHVSIWAFLLSILATLYPAWRASKTQPAEALRYE